MSGSVIDKHGGVWIATLRSGIYYIKPTSIKAIGVEEGLSTGNIYPIFQASNQSIWIGTHGSGAINIDYDDKHINNLESNNRFNSIAEVDGEIWIIGSIICIINEKSECKTEKPEPFLSSTINGKNGDIGAAINQDAPFRLIYQDKQNRVWLGGLSGTMWLRENNQWRRLSKADGWDVNAEVISVMQSPNGDLWFGTNGNGLIHFNNNTFTKYNTQWNLKSQIIRSLLWIDDNQILIGTEDMGLCRFILDQPQDIQCINKNNNFNSISINHLNLDKSKRVWWSSNIGVFWQHLDSLQAVFDKKITALPPGGIYNQSNGMRNSESNGGAYPSGFIDKDDKLWIPTQQGVAIFDTKETKSIDNTNTIIQSIITASQTIKYNNSPIKLAPKERNIQIKLTALSYSDPKNIEFRYRFSNQNENWITIGNNRSPNISNLSKGKQTLGFSARNKGGDWQVAPTLLTLIVTPFWYETLVAKILALLAVISVIIYVFKWRNQKLIQRAMLLEEIVKERTLELKQISDKRTDFFANISHELRTPLTLILGPIDDALNDELSLHKKDLKLIYNSAQRMKRLVDQMLDLQKIDAKKLQLHCEQHNLMHFLAACIAPFELLSNKLKIKLILKNKSDDETKLLQVSIDELQMEKVIGNLLSNAIKFSPSNSEININVKVQSGYIQISVLDYGTGLPMGSENRIFNRFSQEVSTGERVNQGTGIGLALVKEITELHGGTVKAHNHKKGGACFTVSLPIPKRHPQTAITSELKQAQADSNITETKKLFEKHVHTTNNESTVPNNQRVKILIVEDNKDLQNYISSHLEPQFQVVIADDGEKGLIAAKTHIPDIIISDVMMPNLNGFEMAKQLRQDPITDFIPFIFLTAKVTIEDELEGLTIGADDYITKPFSKVLLIARIKSILDARQRLALSLQQSPGLIKKTEASSSLKEKATVVILENISDPKFAVQQLADALFMSRSKLHRQLKSKHDITAQALQRSIRMSEAVKLLRNQQGNVSEVCCAVGYTNLSSFSQIFKETFGAPPSEHIKPEIN